ncbi:unnamed protein product [Paramecium octaurelia]|uniref:Uncharacterized protein n=1 Tax=Paramecium octaurelia TaxID=43137 RepID=A0A8S1UIL1_PAROT|nr:unnamed protein product [Paramecium octaurelia]
MISFQPFVHHYSNYSFYANIYLCQHDKKLYYQLGKRYQEEQISNSYSFIICKPNCAYVLYQLIQHFIKLNYLISEKQFFQSTLKINQLLYYSPPIMANNSYSFQYAGISSSLVFLNYYYKNESYIYPCFILYYTSNLQFYGGELEKSLLPSTVINYDIYISSINEFRDSLQIQTIQFNSQKLYFYF